MRVLKGPFFRFWAYQNSCKRGVFYYVQAPKIRRHDWGVFSIRYDLRCWMSSLAYDLSISTVITVCCIRSKDTHVQMIRKNLRSHRLLLMTITISNISIVNISINDSSTKCLYIYQKSLNDNWSGSLFTWSRSWSDVLEVNFSVSFRVTGEVDQVMINFLTTSTFVYFHDHRCLKVFSFSKFAAPLKCLTYLLIYIYIYDLFKIFSYTNFKPLQEQTTTSCWNLKAAKRLNMLQTEVPCM